MRVAVVNIAYCCFDQPPISSKSKKEAGNQSGEEKAVFIGSKIFSFCLAGQLEGICSKKPKKIVDAEEIAAKVYEGDHSPK